MRIIKKEIRRSKKVLDVERRLANYHKEAENEKIRVYTVTLHTGTDARNISSSTEDYSTSIDNIYGKLRTYTI